MVHYTLTQWMCFFYLYSFAGWVIESAIVSVSTGKLVNRGFLRSPMLPLYGSGAVLILAISIPLEADPAAVYFGGMIGATALEYCTAAAMESMFKMKYWDYTGQRFQFQGRICLKSSLFWGVLSVVLTEYLHPPVERFVLGLPAFTAAGSVFAVTAAALADAVFAVRAALDLKKLLERITRIRAELETASRQLLEQLGAPPEEAQALRARIDSLKDELRLAFSRVGFLKSQLIKAHPHASSRHFGAALAELRERIEQRVQKALDGQNGSPEERK